MNKSMQHWNGDQMCVIDIETTGLQAGWHDIWELAIVPLDSNLEVRKDIIPFCVIIKPDHPHRIDEKALNMNRKRLLDALKTGFDPESVKDMLDEWIKKLGLPINKFGNPKKIRPLGQNYAFEISFMRHWLGAEQYQEYFDYHYCDTMITANYLNDRAAWNAEKVPFPKVNLTYLASQLKIPHDRAHRALDDCLVTAQVYREQLKLGGLFG